MSRSSGTIFCVFLLLGICIGIVTACRCNRTKNRKLQGVVWYFFDFSLAPMVASSCTFNCMMASLHPKKPSPPTHVAPSPSPVDNVVLPTHVAPFPVDDVVSSSHMAPSLPRLR